MSPDENPVQPAVQSALDRFLLTLLGIVGLATVPAAIAWLVMRAVSTGEPPPAAFPKESFPAQGFTLQEYRQEMGSRLDSYGWVDREKGIARVPIELGMKLLLARGLPAREEAPAEERKQ
jgi:hypothetical protein